MKALSIKQPWAELIIAGIKDVENRTWGTSYRGPLLIHAGKVADSRWLDADWRDALGLPPKAVTHLEHVGVKDGLPMALGGIIGCVELIDVRKPFRGRVAYRQWHEYGMTGWYLKNPQRFDQPIPWRGQLGLFDVADDIVRDAMKEGPRCLKSPS